MGALFEQYQCSAEYRQLSTATQFIYARAIRHMIEAEDGKVAQMRVSEFKRRHVAALRDYLSETPGIANQMLTTLSRVLSFAVDREIDGVEANVALRAERLKGGEWKRWTDAALEKAHAAMPNHLWRAMMLGLYTGQRLGDCLSMRWGAYDGHGIALTQQKTAEPLWIPCHSALRAELDAWKREATSLTILSNSFGKPWTMNGFKCEWCKAKRNLGIPFAFHGLRKTAAAKLAEAGCSDREIMAITGHRTASEVERYTREAEQRKRAVAAIRKLEKSV